MHKNRYKLLCCALAFSMASLSLTGCQTQDKTNTQESSSQQSNHFIYTDEAATAPSATTLTCLVKATDADTLTLSVMDGAAPKQPDGENATPPEHPDGENTTPPEHPDGENTAPPEHPDGETAAQTATLTLLDSSILRDSDGNAVVTSAISVGSMLLITFDENSSITSIVVSDAVTPSKPQGEGMSDHVATDYQSAETFTADATLDHKTLSSTGTDENAILVTAGTLTVNQSTIRRTSADSTGGDQASFYGIGAAALSTNGTLQISDSTITTDADGGAGLFAYGTGTIHAENCTISTTRNTSGGIHVAGGGTLKATNLTVTTDGESAAAIRSDRGGGTMTINEGTYTSNGTGSPAVYCTADIAVQNAALHANGSEAVCIEGRNSLKLTDCDISSNMADDPQNDTTWSLIVYQSMSGDAEIGTSTLTVSGGNLTSQNGGILYTTNTACDITFSDVNITYPMNCEFFLRCTGNQNKRGWGTSGANGAQCNFTANQQTMQGDIIWDSISTLNITMQDGSSFTGKILDDESCAGNGGDGSCSLSISEDSVWTVTGDSVLSSLTSKGSIHDDSGNTVTIKNADGTIYESGTSVYSITVDSYNELREIKTPGKQGKTNALTAYSNAQAH